MPEFASTELFVPGDLVITSRADPPHHTRLPRYVRGAVGTVVECEGHHPLPDLLARKLPAEPEPVYAVRFASRELFGAGDHSVTVDVWQSYLSLAKRAAGTAGTEQEVPR